MTDMLTLIETWGATVADDAATKVWTQANYSRDHQVHLGIDEDDPETDITDLPLVNIMMDTKRVGWQVPAKGHAVDVICAIHKEGNTATGKSNLTKLTGVVFIETFRKLIETAITGIYTEGTDLLRIDSLDIDWSGIDLFPFFLANMSFVVNEDEFQGTDVWE